MNLNNKQKNVLVIYAIVIILVCVFFVPWIFKYKANTLASGYSPLWAPIIYDNDETLKGSINGSMLSVEVVVLTVLAMVALLYFSDKKAS
jgi:hypothetical protein